METEVGFFLVNLLFLLLNSSPCYCVVLFKFDKFFLFKTHFLILENEEGKMCTVVVCY